jgi:hypothetical protein
MTSVKISTERHEVSTSNLQALSVRKIADWLGFSLWPASTLSNPISADKISTDAGEFSSTDLGILEIVEVARHRSFRVCSLEGE